MRVLHISNDYYNSEVYKILHQGFLKNGMDSIFFVPMNYSDKKPEEAHVVQAHCFDKRDRYLYMNKQKKVYREFRKVLQAHQPELNHSFFLYSGGIHCLWAKQEFGIPYVVSVQNTDLNTVYKWMPHLRGLARRILREAEEIFFVSAAYQEFVLDHVVNADEKEKIAQKCRLVPFAVNPFWTANTDASRHPKHDGPVRLLTVGVVNKSKNQLGVVDAVRILQKRGIEAKLTVIGAVEDQKVDRTICEESFVHRIPHIQKERLISEYRKADVFVLPSFAESFGLVYAEALTQGVPVIYSAGQGFDRQFPEGVVGYPVNAHSPEDIADGIQRVLEEYDELQNNCAQAAGSFTQSTVCSKCEALYREALKQAQSDEKP